MKNQIRLTAIFFSAAAFISGTASIAAQVATGGGYTLDQAVIAGGGGQNSAGNGFAVDGTIGQATAGGPKSNAPFSIFSGFWSPQIFAQTVQFSAAAYSIGEAGPVATITVTRLGGSSGAIGVDYATTNGSATGGATGMSCMDGPFDYLIRTGTLKLGGRQ